MFADRAQAGLRLAQRLRDYRGQDAVVLALPRGGVVVGRQIADALLCPLDIVSVRKIGHPSFPEYAIGAVAERGQAIVNDQEIRLLGSKRISEMAKSKTKEARLRAIIYRAGKKPARITERVAILTDDGAATGLSLLAAIRFTRTFSPAKIVVALPVCSPEAAERIKQEADELIVLLPLPEFGGSVGAHFVSFDQLSDDEVIRLLKESGQRT
jgi:predicted phosphoribosyltransferase